MSKTLWLLRGVSGCGKTTLSTQLCEIPNTIAVTADDYHYDKEGNYNFKFENLKAAHKWCQESVEGLIQHGFNVVVHNTNTTEKEIEPYLGFAKKYGYKVVSLVVENRHSNDSVHDVPQEVREKQEWRLKSNLKLM